MLATASVVAVPNPPRSINTEMLFNHARQLLQRHRDESRMYVVQALFLLAIRQTGKGNKSSAYLYAGQACAMALEMGLHRTSTGTKRASHVSVDVPDRTLERGSQTMEAHPFPYNPPGRRRKSFPRVLVLLCH
jgi:hypothetical protein